MECMLLSRGRGAGSGMRNIGIGALAAVILLAGSAASETLPKPNAFLFWKPDEQAVGYRSIEKIFPTRVIKRGATVSALATANEPFDVSYESNGAKLDTQAYMKATNVSGLIVIKNGKILL